ncbi:MAG: DUF4878 domain-containing protein [Candidatus Coatesbacteria bacterium]|nr:DUF4878 domain-containing protein [Candidatus Coatesbacteria bacterium]
MKKYIIFAFCMLAIIISCKSGKNGPKAVVEDFLVKLKAGDIESAMKLTSKKDRENWELMKKAFDVYNKLDKDTKEEYEEPIGYNMEEVLKKGAQFIEVGSEKIYGDSAVVVLEGKKDNKAKEKQEMKLIKEENKWVIVLGFKFDDESEKESTSE